MSRTVRRVVTVAAASAALLAAGAGLAYADSDDAPGPAASTDSAHGAQGTGSELTGGPTETQVLKGAPAVPLSDPTLGESTLLPPVYNAVNSLSG